ncbi:MAG: RagB/SusD family nutrient uptake outer membrane protein [Flavobacteriales bacterium CG_4_9_14_0_2_um_filter_35_242]|nr:RagB/SusD family nutrient uptake outer membrane protein [Zetaproteobacteria bacterium]OIO10900.1 MAG: RagB/SusD family nutrient uptake outer membrane protein [Flavobacteriaceae bacterium CG1_02_35_72]PIV17361.1 MAG: RagB/SusD family nutrient uptake outer membrane protein [Flavobacteriales bacterium CG03_land_8_20_14_0_80_35_15]PIX05845.1 MAG: RagB/SusD family nutrient uptake outer membrane protein [Flavobacteriales bacterium CG_4_8_14_3_um_filter_35_10]PJA05443.1 MAG: RagB/SusD family nutrie
MKIINNIKFISIAVFGLLLYSCDFDNGTDLNGPSVDAIANNPSRGDIASLAAGVQSDMRVRLGTYLDDCGVVGREYWRFASSDPRFTADLLGSGSSVLDNNTFYTTAPWGARYRTVKSTNILIAAAANATTAGFSPAELSSINGFAKTIQAYELLMNLNLQFQNGIRVDVSDINNLGAFLGYPESLTAIKALLDGGAADLTNGGSKFPFKLSDGFNGFDTPANFKKFNRALAARVALYQGDKTNALSALSESFFDLNGSMTGGVYYVFANSGNDIANPVFNALNSSTAGARIVQPSFITDAELGDLRLNKVVQRDAPLTLDGLTGNYDAWVFTSNDAPIPIIRNEELILIYAEANIGTNLVQSLAAINKVRNIAGLTPYAGATDNASLLNEVLHERRYSLYAEGHRWIDMRRTGKLAQLPLDRPGDDVWEQFPRPLTEN